MPDITDQLDAAIGASPPDAPDLRRTLVLGRRALRRRRLAYGVGAVATAVVIGGTAWAVQPGDEASRSQDPDFGERSPNRTTESATPMTDEPPPDRPRRIDWLGEDAAMLGRDGRLLVKTGWSVASRIDEVGGPGTIGVEITKGDRRQWYLFGTSMTISSLHAPSEGHATFQEWVAVNAPLLDDKGPDGGQDVTDWPGVPRDDLVAFDDGEDLVALPGVTIVEQRPSPAVGDSFARQADTSAVAVVEVDGERWYVLARDVDGPAEYIAVPRSEGGPDLDAFLDLARERYAEGGGGLL